MPDGPVLHGEGSLPATLRTLLREPPPDGVWHLPGHLPEAPLHLITWLVDRALHAVTGKAPPPDSDLEGDAMRLGIWLTEDHLLLVDEEGPRAVRRADITSLRVHRVGRRKRDMLAVELRQGRLRFAVDILDGWAGRAEALQAEIDRRQRVWRARARVPATEDPVPVSAPGATAEDYAANRQFDGFVRWLDGEVRRLQPVEVGRAGLRELTEAALASWPDETRRAPSDWFLAGDTDGGRRRRFARDEASWLLPLSRAVTLDAVSHLADVVSVLDCAATFRDVPLTVIEVEGSLGDEPFEAVLTWAATKTLKMLAVTGANERQRARLADFKRAHGIA